jgi:hypothetical protein
MGVSLGTKLGVPDGDELGSAFTVHPHISRKTSPATYVACRYSIHIVYISTSILQLANVISSLGFTLTGEHGQVLTIRHIQHHIHDNQYPRRRPIRRKATTNSMTNNLFLRLTFCLSLQKKESKYNRTAGHHVPRSIALPLEELPFRRLNGPICLYCGSLYSWWGVIRL